MLGNAVSISSLCVKLYWRFSNWYRFYIGNCCFDIVALYETILVLFHICMVSMLVNTVSMSMAWSAVKTADQYYSLLKMMTVPELSKRPVYRITLPLFFLLV